MGTVTFFEHIDRYLGDFFDVSNPNVVTTRAVNKFAFNSGVAGHKVVVTGTGFDYDGGVPIDGTITKVEIQTNGGTVLWRLVGISPNVNELADFYLQTFGFDRPDGSHHDPSGFDTITALLSGPGNVFNGSDEDDDITAGFSPGNDTMNGNGGNDFIKGDRGNDKLNGGADHDTLSYQETFYRQDAFRGINLNAATGKVADSWGGTDTISNFENYTGSRFADVMTGKGIDEGFKGLKGADTINGGGGWDEAIYDQDREFGGNKGINANLQTGKISDGWGDVDTVSNIEQVGGTVKADTFVGNTKDNRFLGLAGKDSYNGGGGWDEVNFNPNGEDWAGPTNTVGVKVDLNAANEILNDGFGNAENAENIEAIWGSRKNDTLNGDNLSNFLGGNDGADVIDTRGGNDHITGWAGKDTLTGGAGNDRFYFHFAGNADADVVTDFGNGADRIGLIRERLDGLPGGANEIPLPGSAFLSGAGKVSAENGQHRVIYNTSNGKLYVDLDGVGGDASQLVATLNGAPSLTAGMILLFDT